MSEIVSSRRGMGSHAVRWYILVLPVGHRGDPARALRMEASRSVKRDEAMLEYPYKFTASVLSALGETGETDEFLQLDRLAALSGMPCPPQLRNLQSKPVRFPDTCSKDRMLQSLYAFLHI